MATGSDFPFYIYIQNKIFWGSLVNGYSIAVKCFLQKISTLYDNWWRKKEKYIYF